MAANDSVPFWWIVLFVVIALGAGIGAVAAVGGNVFPGAAVALLA